MGQLALTNNEKNVSLSNDQAIVLNIDGIEPALSMYLHGENDQIISARIRQNGVWEEYETKLTLDLVKAGDVYVDVGANIGYYSLIASRCVGASGKVISYEPDPENYALLEANIALNELKNVHTYNLALYDQDKTGQLFLSGDNLGDHRIYESPEARESRAITLVHGGKHVSSQSTHVDFLKIDTQGAEFFVVNGLYELICANKDHLKMILEVCPYGIRKSGSDGMDLLKLLDDSGMQYHIIDHIGHTLIPAQSHDLSEWILSLADDPLNEGFINLLVTPANYQL